MGNTESNESNAAGRGEGDPPRRPNNNGRKAAVAAAALTGVALAGLGLAKLASSSASEEDEKTTNNFVRAAGSSRGYRSPTHNFADSSYDRFPNENTYANNFADSPYDRLPNEHSYGNNFADSPYDRFPNENPYGNGKLISGRRKLKMNTDGSVRGYPAQAGFGGVIRDENGIWVMGFYGKIFGECTIEQAEIWGIYHGLKIIQDKKLREVEILSDSQAAIDHIKSKTRSKSPMAEKIEECKEMLRTTGCTLEHIPREDNKVADKLADLGRSQDISDLGGRKTNLVLLSDVPNQEFERLLEASG